MNPTVRLKARFEYVNRERHYTEGQIFETSEDDAAWLMRDAPGVFETVVTSSVQAKAVAAAPANKMVGSAPASKGVVK